MVKVSLLLCLLIVACRGFIFDDGVIDGPARLPSDNVQYTYSFKASGASDSSFETVRFTLLDRQRFLAICTGSNGVAICDSFHVREDDDLESVNLIEVYPIGTRGSYQITAHGPTDVNGKCRLATTESDFKYERTE